MPTKSLQATIFGVDKASTVFDKVGKSADEMAGDVEKSGSRMGSAFSKGAKLAAGALAAVGFTEFVKGTITEASNLQQNIGAVESVFKSTAGTITSFGETSAETVGIAKQDYFQLATIFGAQLKNMGLAVDDLAPKTNELVQLGADLSSMYGGTAAEAVEAISSLLRGERDPIERYGVSIKQASISAYELAHGLDTSTAEAKMASDTQAALALLFEQTSDAQGNFARESDTLAGAQQRATAKFKEAQAEIGTKLLPILTDLTTFAAQDLVPILGTVADVLGGVIDIIDAIPGPVKIALAALVGFKLFQQTAVFEKLAVGARGFRDEMVLQQGLAKMEGVELSSMGAAAAVARPKVAGLAKTLGKGGLLAGGIWVVSSIVGEFEKMSKATENAEQSTRSLSDALVESGGAWDDAAKKQRQAQVEGMASFQTMIDAGLSYSDIMRGMTGSTDDFARLMYQFGEADKSGLLDSVDELGKMHDAITTNAEALAGQKIAYEKSESAAKLFAESQDDARSSAVAATEAWRDQKPTVVDLNAALKETGGVTGSARTAMLQWKDAHAKATVAAKATADAATATSEAVRKTADEFRDAAAKAMDLTSGANAVTDALDKLSGRQVTVEEATRKWNGILTDAASALKRADDDTGTLRGSVDKLSGAVDTSTTSGQKLYDWVTSAASSARDLALAQGEAAGKIGGTEAAADAASKAMAEQRTQFEKAATSAGLTADQVKKLADRYLDLPKNVATTIKANTDFSAALAEIQRIADKTVWVNVKGRMSQGVAGQLGTAGGPQLARAGGGWISGPGTSTSDSVPLMASDGEFVVSASKASKYGALLERINFGPDLPGRAGGGWAGGSGAVATMSPVVRVEVTLRGDGVITDAMAREAGVQIADRARQQLRDRRSGVMV